MEKLTQVYDVDGEDIPMVVITGVLKPAEVFVQNAAACQPQQQQQQRLIECCPTISESNILEEENLEIFCETTESEDSRRSSATSDSSIPISSNHSSPRSSFSSAITPPTFLPHSSTAHYYRRPSSNTLQVPSYAEIGFLHHRNSASALDPGDRMSINTLRADFLRRRSLSSLQPHLFQDVSELDPYGQRRFSAPPPSFHPEMKYRRSSSLCRDLKQNFLRLRRASDMVREFIPSLPKKFLSLF